MTQIKLIKKMVSLSENVCQAGICSADYIKSGQDKSGTGSGQAILSDEQLFPPKGWNSLDSGNSPCQCGSIKSHPLIKNFLACIRAIDYLDRVLLAAKNCV